MPRSFIRAAVPAGLAAALVFTLAPGARADDPIAPVHPEADQVRQAHETVDDKADAVTRIEAELDREATDLGRLDIRAGLAVEAYNGAVVLSGQAQDQAIRADGLLRTADAQLVAARDELGRLAAQTYRMGGGSQLGVFQAVLGADSPGDFVTRLETLRRISQDSDNTLERGATAVRDATAAKTDAAHTAAEAERATAAVRAAKERVEAELAAQQRRVQESAARRTALIGELAATKQTSVALETERRDRLAAEAQQRAEVEAEARARAEADAEEAREVARKEAERRAEEARTQAQSKPTKTSKPAKTTAKPATKPTPKPTTKKPTTKKPATKKPATKKPATKKPATKKPATPSKSTTSNGAAAAIAYAKAQLGKPYVWGGAGPRGYDCSGLVMQAWRKAGVGMAHFAATQYRESTPVSYKNLRPGDLIFWTETRSASGIHHVAMYLGGGKMIHAPRTGDVVKISNMFYMGTPDYYARPS
ncbi:NlpC/P60 family protein [Embleya sp. NBC_00896]|uniref:C40 family peptidase n=1 Tax=Embleya sp. NBC_00896 TaxID=2975961 RepID=UPI00386650B0|nr:C40 family peptidase [Embleya sp. NBC_00896]